MSYPCSLNPILSRRREMERFARWNFDLARPFGRKSPPKASLALPYSALASQYDASLGRDFFRRTRRAFESLQRRYGFSFHSAADLGCGTGLFAKYLATHWNVPVFAVDRSAEMLACAARLCRDAPVQTLLQDIRDLRLPNPTDLITANYDVINHLLKPADVCAVFRRVNHNLQPQGRFYFDAMCPCQRIPRNRWNVWKRSTTRGEMEQRIFWDQPRELMFIQVLSRKPGSPGVEVENHTERLYQPAMICRWLHDAGFARVFAHDEESAGPVESCVPRVIFLASKWSHAGERRPA